MNSNKSQKEQIKETGSSPDNQVESEPHAPSISNMPSMLSQTDEEEKQRILITETEGYKAGMKLLQLVFQEDREEITKQALLHSDSLQEGL